MNQFPLDPGGDWDENKRHVLAEMGRQGKALEHMDTSVESLKTEYTAFKLDVTLQLANLRFKQTMWGAITAGVPTLVGVLLWYFSQHH